MAVFELVLALLLGGVGLALLAPRLSVPWPALLAVAGAAPISLRLPLNHSPTSLKSLKAAMSETPTSGTTPRAAITLGMAGHTMAFALFATQDGRRVPGGTGAIIGKNLAITAWHVIKEFYREFMPQVEFTDWIEFRKNHVDPFKLEFNIFGICFSSDHPQGLPLNFEVAHVSPFSDMVLMRFSSVGAQLKVNIPRLHAKAPRVGAKIQAVGFDFVKIDESNGLSIVLYQSLGTVQEVFYEKRGEGMLPFPVFQTEAEVAHGMSGGPVYSEAHYLCGMLF